MRHSTSRSAIYVVIGIGLFVLTVAQLRQRDGMSSASFVARSNPFEALQGYQRADVSEAESLETAPIAKAKQEINRLPKLDLSLDKLASDSTAIEDEVTSNFVNATDQPEPIADEDHLLHGIEIAADDLTPSNDQIQMPAISPMEAITSEVAQLPAPTAPVVDRISTAMPAFTKEKRQNQNLTTNQPTDNELASPMPSKDGSLQSTRWKKNPFLTNAPLDSASEALIKTEFVETGDELSTVVNLEATPATVAKLASDSMVPAVDPETMQSVISADENLEIGSPSIKVGISEADAQKAVHNIEYGKSLSRRGAAYAARQEFYASLRILAQSHDKQIGGTAYTEALRNGIVAIKEAQDFIVTDTETQIGLNVSDVIETHSTKVISTESAQSMTAIEAVQRYFAYASHQLSRCGGQNVVAAEALYCLGKLHSVEANNGPNPSKLDVAKSMVYHQAAVSADPYNYRSLNELGVLYANSGRFEESKQMLKKSLRINQLPQAWQNLAVIHQRMGENNLAELAIREFQMTSAQAPSSAIQWTAVAEFNENAPLLQRTASQVNGVAPAFNDTNSTKSNLKSLGGRILNSIR